ncbi:TonB-dependent receptor, partial [Parabacteroides distasonis]
GMNKGMFANADLAAGTSDRYSSRAMAATFNDKMKVMGFGSANNVNDQGFPGGGGRWGGRSNGLNATKMLGVNVNYEKKDKLIINGHVRWNHSDGDVFSRTSTENFLSTSGSFSNRTGQNYSRSNSWNGQMRLEWMPDTMTNILFRPSFSISTSDGLNTSRSATFNDDPYKYVSDPLNDIDEIDKENKVNLTNNRSLS